MSLTLVCGWCERWLASSPTRTAVRIVACDGSYCVMYCRISNIFPRPCLPARACRAIDLFLSPDTREQAGRGEGIPRIGFKTAYARFFVFGVKMFAKTFLTALNGLYGRHSVSSAKCESAERVT